MKSELDKILSNSSLSVDEKTEKVTEYLRSLPDKGVSTAIDYLKSSNDATLATYPSNYLSLLPNLEREKQELFDHVLNDNKNLIIAMANHVKDMPCEFIERLVHEYFKDSSFSGFDSVLFEIARFFPGKLQQYSSRFDDPLILDAILPGIDGSLVSEISERYRRELDLDDLRSLAVIRTDEAIEALIELESFVPDDDKSIHDMFMDNAGVFLDSRESSIYLPALRGIVDSRSSSPHYMGGDFRHPVPMCPVCKEPADRILTLDVTRLEIDLECDRNPSFFWYTCPHPPSHVVVRVLRDGIEGLMTPMTNKPARGQVIPGSLSMILKPHSNQLGFGIELMSGYSHHQVGGYPPWVEMTYFPRCPDCARGMRFLASIDSGMTSFGRMNFDGTLYGFWCDDCSISATILQNY